MYTKLPLKENKQILADNLTLLSSNVRSVGGIVPSGIVEKFQHSIGVLNYKLKSVRNNTAFVRLFFEYFLLMQNFHSTINTFECSDLVDQKYEGYQFLKPF
jgi:hypothetical protein